MKINRAFLFVLFGGLLAGLLAGALVVLITSRPRGRPVELRPAPTASPIFVDVGGAVARPGVYALAQGSRLLDAVQAAGGFDAGADSSAVNQAEHLQDGDKITIPRLGETISQPAIQPQTGGSIGATPESLRKAAPIPTLHGPVNINTATLEELETLPGIGPTRAQDILDYRKSHGDFKTIDEIQNVTGIGPATFEELKDKITVK